MGAKDSGSRRLYYRDAGIQSRLPRCFKNALDSIYQEWNNKPVGFVSWGGAAGVRSVEQLRQVAIELQMAPIRNAVHISSFGHCLMKADS